MTIRFGLFLGILAGISALAHPVCYDGSDEIAVDNQQVLDWKSSTPNQFRARAHIAGRVTKLYANHSGHTHFQARLGDDPDDTLEVIFNDEFDSKLSVHVGQEVEACGDYITSTRPTQYPVSPDHGLIHWLHENPRHHGHEDGFLILDGDVYGGRP